MNSLTNEELNNNHEVCSIGGWLYSDVQLIVYKCNISIRNENYFVRINSYKDKKNLKSEWRQELHYRGYEMPLQWSLELINPGLLTTDFRAVFRIRSFYDGNNFTTVEVTKPHNFSRCKKLLIESTIDSDFKKCFKRMPEGTANIYCTIAVLNINSTMVRKVDEGLIQADIEEMNLSKSLEDNKFTDVTLYVGDRRFQAHKIILASRSEVFAAMFQHPFEESTKNRIEITDIQPDVFQELLIFIYTNKAPNLKAVAKDLLKAADKYGLPRLLQMCESQLVGDLHIDSAAEIFLFADLYNAKHLKDHVLEFITMNGQSVMQTYGWKSLITKANIHLVLEILEESFKNL